MLRLFAVAVFASALLLFFVEPMFAKMLLPRVGGAAAVWSTCLVFFQAALLAAYAYAYAAPSRLGEARHAKLHVVVLLLPAICLPLAVRGGAAPMGGDDPTWWVLASLTLSVGLPFFVLATTTPLLSRWFAVVAPGQDPYWLYAASNVGSLVALIAYPFVVEPLLSLRTQSIVLAVGYGVFACLCAGVAVLRVRARSEPAIEASPHALDETLEWSTKARWIALAFVPSSLMIGATSYITTDVASAPMLWLPPLAFYLLSFVIVFGRRAPSDALRVLGPAYVGLASSLFLFALLPLSQHIVVGALHVLLVFVASIVFHGELARRRPEGRAITTFYLCIALGGALGGVVSAIVAPLVFRRVVEYPLVMAAAIWLVPKLAPPRSDEEREAAFLRSLGIDPTSAPRRAPVAASRAWSPLDVVVPVVVAGLALALFTRHLEGTRGAFARYGIPIALCVVFSIGRRARLAAGLVAIALVSRFDSAALHEERSFFGVIRVEESAGLRSFFHGTTIHGRQSLDPASRRDPLDYYDRDGPAGVLFASLPNAPRRVGVVGLGAGELAAYSEAGQRWTFFEIDAAVERVARKWFTYLADSPAKVDVVLGDGRLVLARGPDAEFDLLVLDAFSSDAIPTHLVTREAIALYMQKLTTDGVLVFHVTNRYVRLERVISALARDAHLEARLGSISRDDAKNGVPGTWIVVARSLDSIGALATRWRTLRDPNGRVWSDDYTNLLGAILDR